MSMGFGGGGGDGLGDLFAAVRIDTSGLKEELAQAQAAMQGAAGAAEQLEGAADRASGSLRRKADSARAAADSAKQLDEQSRRAAYNIMQLGRIADDAQYLFQNGMGLRPIINNLMEINPAVGFAALGIDLLIRHWDKLSEVLDPTQIKVYIDEIDTLRHHIKEWEHSPPTLAVDLRQLDNARDQLDDMVRRKHAFDQLMSGRTAIEIESGKAFQAALSNAPGGPEAVAAAVRGKMAEQLTQESPKFQAKTAALEEDRQRIEMVRERMKGEDPVLRAMSQIQIAGIEHEIDELTNDLGKIRENMREQAKIFVRGMFGGAKLGTAEDIEKSIQWMQRAGIGRPTVFGAEMARPEAVVLPKDRHQTERAIHEIARAQEKAERDAEAAAEKTATGQIQDIVTGFRPKLQGAIDERGAQLVKEGKTDAEIKKALEEMVAERLKTAGVQPRLIQAGAIGVVDEGMRRLQAAIAGRAGAGREAAAGEILSDIEEKRKRTEEAQAARERRREAETPEQRARRQAIEKAAHRVEGGAGGLAEQLEPVVMAKIAQGIQTERILAGLGPQVARRIRGIPGVGPGLAGEVGTQVVRDVIAKSEAPIAANMGMGAPNVAIAAQGAAGRALAHNQQAMMHRQQEAMARDVAAQFMAQGATQQQAVALGHRTVGFMAKGLNVMQAMEAAYSELIRHAGQMDQRLGRIERQFHNTRRRANLLNRGGPAG